MKKLLLLFTVLVASFGVASWSNAATTTISALPSTNAVQTNDLVVIDVYLSPGSYTTRVVTPVQLAASPAMTNVLDSIAARVASLIPYLQTNDARGFSLTNGGNTLAASNVTFQAYPLAGTVGRLSWVNGTLGSPDDGNANMWINKGHGGSGNGVEWQMTVNQMYLGPVDGGHFQFGLSTDQHGDGLVMQYHFPVGMTSNSTTMNLGWKSVGSNGWGGFWDAHADVYHDPAAGYAMSELWFDGPEQDGNQDWHTNSAWHLYGVDMDGGIDIPGYERVGFRPSAPGVTNVALDFTNAEVQEVDLTTNAFFYVTNLNLYSHFSNFVSISKRLILPNTGIALAVTFPTNFIWTSENSSNFPSAPTNLPATSVMLVDIDATLGAATNFYAHASYAATPPFVYDVNALAFFNAAGVTNLTQKLALNTLVVAMKTNSLWSMWDCVYPLVGASAASEAWNLINTNSYKITWTTNASVFWANGWLSDGSASLADTGFNPASAPGPNYTQNSATYFVYSGSNNPYGGTNLVWIGSIGAGVRSSLLVSSSHPQISEDGMNNGTGVGGGLVLNVAHTHGGMGVSVLSSSTQWLYGADGTASATASATTTGVPNGDVYFGARNNAGLQFPISANFEFVAIGSGLTQTQFNTLTNIVGAFETSLGRP